MPPSNQYVPATKDSMLAGFPEPPPGIQGEPTLVELLRILKHLMACSISYRTEGNNGLNLLHRCVDTNIYRTYMADPANMTFPGDADDPGEAPTFTEGDGTNHATWVAEQLEWEKASKTKKDEKTMDQCLVTRLLSLIEPLYRANYEYEQMRDPNKPFRDVLQSFIRRYGTSTEAERKANRDRLGEDWALTDGFEALEIRINEALEYADIAGQPITESEAIDAGMTALVKTGLFESAYEEWNARAAAQKSWAHFKTWAKDKVTLKKNTQQAAGQFGYGMGAAEDAGSIENSVGNFSAAHSATQQTIAGLTQQLQQQATLLPVLQQQVENISLMMQQMNMLQQQKPAPAGPSNNNNNNNRRSTTGRTRNGTQGTGGGGGGGRQQSNNGDGGKPATTPNP